MPTYPIRVCGFDWQLCSSLSLPRVQTPAGAWHGPFNWVPAAHRGNAEVFQLLVLVMFRESLEQSSSWDLYLLLQSKTTII